MKAVLVAGVTLIIQILMAQCYSLHFLEDAASFREGQPFSRTTRHHRLVRDLEEATRDEIPIKDIADFPIVSVASANHYEEYLSSLYNLTVNNMNRTIYFYDIGLTDVQVRHLKSLNLVNYRQLDFTKYPKHVSNLRTYAFKVVLLAEMLLMHDAVLYIDASGRFFPCFNDHQFMETVLTNVYQRGFHMFHSCIHSIGGMTHPLMYKYLNIDGVENKIFHTSQYSAAFFLVSRKTSIYKNVIRWHLLCAMEEECMAPPPAKQICHWPKGFLRNLETSSYYAGDNCHRFDQSSINLLLAIYFNFDVTKYSGGTEKCMALKRSPDPGIIRKIDDYVFHKSSSRN